MTPTAQMDRQVVEAPKRGLARLNIQVENIASGVVLVGLVIVLSLVSPAFLSFSNFLDIARVVAITGIIAAGMTLVIITGGIDLSVGSTVGLVGAVTASLVANSASNSATSRWTRCSAGCATVTATRSRSRTRRRTTCSRRRRRTTPRRTT